MFAYVRSGLRDAGVDLARVIHARPLSRRRLAVDLLIGVGVVVLYFGLERVLSALIGSGNQDVVKSIIVHNRLDVPLWIVLAIAAGIVEELTFRGYLQRQFASLGGRWFGVVAQAVLFGVTHGYQGATLVLTITLFGLLFGTVAAVRGSLVPGMFAHVTVDLIGGLQQLA